MLNDVNAVTSVQMISRALSEVNCGTAKSDQKMGMAPQFDVRSRPFVEWTYLTKRSASGVSDPSLYRSETVTALGYSSSSGCLPSMRITDIVCSRAREYGPKPIAPSTSLTVSIDSWVVIANLERCVSLISFQPGMLTRNTESVLSASSRRTTLILMSLPPT